MLLLGAAWAEAQPSRPKPVFDVEIHADREPVVAGGDLRLALVLEVDHGWHVNSNDPGDEFSLPTTVKFLLPDGWPVPVVGFPDGEALEFEFSDTPIEVWEGRAVILAGLTVPETGARSTPVQRTE